MSTEKSTGALIFDVVIKLIVIAIGLVLAFFTMIYINLFGVFSPSPPKPEVKYGEFPFKLTYELNGETKVIEDVIICEYDGSVRSGSERKRKWKKTFKSGAERIVLLQIDETSFLQCLFPNAEHYMGEFEYSTDEEYDEWHENNFHNWFVAYTFFEDDGRVNFHFVNLDRLYEKYGIKMIDIETSPPIQNTFK